MVVAMTAVVEPQFREGCSVIIGRWRSLSSSCPLFLLLGDTLLLAMLLFLALALQLRHDFGIDILLVGLFRVVGTVPSSLPFHEY